MKRWWLVLVIVAALVFAALAAGGYLLARYWQTAQPAYSRIEVSAVCDLRAGPCRVSVAGGVLEFAIDPRDIPLMRPLSLQVEVAIPPDQPVGSVLPLTFDVDWVAARSTGAPGRISCAW